MISPAMIEDDTLSADCGCTMVHPYNLMLRDIGGMSGAEGEPEGVGDGPLTAVAGTVDDAGGIGGVIGEDV